MRAWFPLWLFGIFAVSHTFAGLGETPEETDKRYGAPMFGQSMPGFWDGTTTRHYHVKGLSIIVVFYDKQSVEEHRSKDDGSALSEAEVKQWMEAEAEGRKWVARKVADPSKLSWVLEDRTLYADWRQAPKNDFAIGSLAFVQYMMEREKARR